MNRMSTKALKKKMSKIAEKGHIGEELTDWESIDPSKMEAYVREQLKVFSYFQDHKDAASEVVLWMNGNGYEEKEIRSYRAAPYWETSMTMGGLARMSRNGAPFDDERINWIKSRVDRIVNEYAKFVKNDGNESNDLVSTFKTDDKVFNAITDIEEAIDRKEDFSVYEKLTAESAPKKVAAEVSAYYTPIRDELALAYTGKDKEIAEGYQNLKKSEIKRLRDMYSMIVNDANKYQNAKDATRKPRVTKTKTKKVDTSKLVQGLRHKKQDMDLKLASVNPESVIGADTIYLYDTVKRKMTMLVSLEGGFTVRGSTIFNINEEQSETRIVKNNQSTVLDKFTEGNKTVTKKKFKTINTKPSKATGRTNNDTLILKVFK